MNPVGAGDAMLAGFLHAESAGMEEAAALGQAIATGSAAALRELAGVVDAEDIQRLRAAIHVEQL